MINLKSVLKSNTIHTKNIILPSHIHPDQIDSLIELGFIIEEIIKMSGTSKVEAGSIEEGLARLDAEFELARTVDYFHDSLNRLGMSAKYKLYTVEHDNVFYHNDVYDLPDLGLEIEIFHQDDLLAA